MPIINGQGGQAKFVINKLFSVGDRLIALYYNGAIDDITDLEGLYEHEGVALPEPIMITPASFAGASDEQIDVIISLAQAGQLDISDYWTVGDTRTVNLAAMAATGVGESHDKQTVVLEIAHSFEKNGALADISATNGSLLIQLKDCLNKGGYMNSSGTNAGGWNSSARRTWCNNVFPNSLPTCFKDHMLTMNIKTYNNGSVSVTQDKSALWCEKNIFGSRSQSYEAEANAATQVKIYKTAANRIKKMNGSAHDWWERSPYSSGTTDFCYVYDNGSASAGTASAARGLAPFFCI